MADKPFIYKPSTTKDEGEKHPGHVNAIVYAAGDSMLKSRIWSLSASIASYFAFKKGLENKGTAKVASQAAAVVTAPERFVKELYSSLTNKPMTPPDVKRNAPLTAAFAIGLIVEYVSALPYFKTALSRINKINAANDAVRAENIRLKTENEQLGGRMTMHETTKNSQALRVLDKSMSDNTPASRIIQGGKPVSHADAVAAGQEKPPQSIR